MSITRLPEIVFPLAQVNKVNEIVDVLNDNLNMYYSEENPALTSVEGIATWTVTHNLGTENVNCSLYNGDMLVLSSVSITSENVVTVSLNSDTNIPADTYKIVIISNGAGSSSGSGSYVLPTASTTTLGGVRIDGSSIKINNGVISSSVDSTLSSTSTNPIQNKVITEALNKIEGRKYDVCTGNIASSNIDSAFKCIGGATITIYDCSDLVRIDYEYVVTSAGTMSGDWQYGLSAEYLKNNSSYGVVPDINPISGGHLVIYNNSGYINNDLPGYGGSNIANGKYWPPARVFNAGSGSSPNYVFGQWPQNMIGKGTRIAGVAYGTYTR